MLNITIVQNIINSSPQRTQRKTQSLPPPKVDENQYYINNVNFLLNHKVITKKIILYLFSVKINNNFTTKLI